ncbi:MAG: ACP phosphodiesterase [Nostoc sp.]|uniref:acyl carrier protein phosphodiesterase n=1 Tax=Nostoc sp. TaxID=1180 RepID=UPI002FFA55D8
MNYLAHLFLSQYTTGFLIGGLLGDFVKGNVEHIYTGDIKKGIYLHRKIDVYTDTHNIFCSSKRLISPKRRRFAGILIDLFYDHFLAKNWSEYSNIELFHFSQHVYNVLQSNQDLLPESLKLILPSMISQDWLTSYREVAAVENALKRISARVKRENDIKSGIEDLLSNYQQLESNFLDFFCDLMSYTNNLYCQLDSANQKQI